MSITARQPPSSIQVGLIASFCKETDNLDSSTLSAGSPAQFHDAVDTMETEGAYTEGQDDTMGGMMEDSHTPTRRHAQSQSADFPSSHQGYSASPTADVDPNARYPTPPTSFAPSISRPNSGLSGNGGYGNSNMQSSYQDPNARGAGDQNRNKNSVVIKVGMVGDAQIGKTSLMVKYVEGSWDEDYIQTLGVNFMEKTISIRNTEITFSIWDLGGQREFVNMLPLVCNDAVAILFMFDLTRKSTLNSIKEWYRQGRGFNKTAIPFLVGTKYDHFVNFPREDQEEISNQVRYHPFASYHNVNTKLFSTRPAGSQKQCEQVSSSAVQATVSMSKRYSPLSILPARSPILHSTHLVHLPRSRLGKTLSPDPKS